MLDWPQIAKSRETQYAGKGFQVQYVGDAEKLILQVKKQGVVRFLLGFDKAIGVTLEHLSPNQSRQAFLRPSPSRQQPLEGNTPANLADD